MLPHGFLRTAAASPTVRVADPAFNAARTVDLLRDADARGADLVVFPECGLTGYTCHDLFHQHTLIDAAAAALGKVIEASETVGAVAVVGLPVSLDGRLFNAAAVVQGGRLLGVVPKTYLPNYKEFYDARYFAPAAAAVSKSVRIAGQTAPFGTDLLFAATNADGFVLGVEICEDLWMPVPPSSLASLAGATVIANLSASNEIIGKVSYRRNLVVGQSGRCLAGYVYAAAGPGESSTDLVFGGHCLIAENGSLLAESARFRRDSHLTVVDLDVERLTRERTVTGSFSEGNRSAAVPQFRRVEFAFAEREPRTPALIRPVDAHPFVPSDPATLRERCEEIFQTQVTALATRLDHIGRPPVAIGISGGLDSTLALLVVCKTFDALGEPRSKIKGLTMPGFGTTGRTLANARKLMADLGVSATEVDIRQICLDQMRALNHAPFGIPLAGLSVDSLTENLRALPADRRHDLVFENVQARARTSMLMNTGFTIGTGDLSELTLGWCTYNADHMSMYNPNVGIPKTLVKFLVGWAADAEFSGDTRLTLHDVVATEISPELLPTAADGSVQSTEGTIGPYELHDFFLYHVLRFGSAPDKIQFLAHHTKFDRDYTEAEIAKWLTLFAKRFFANQFKRSCLPDGPKVGSVSVSPRGDLRMPSDAHPAAWLARIDRQQ